MGCCAITKTGCIYTGCNCTCLGNEVNDEQAEQFIPRRKLMNRREEEMVALEIDDRLEEAHSVQRRLKKLLLIGSEHCDMTAIRQHFIKEDASADVRCSAAEVQQFFAAQLKQLGQCHLSEMSAAATKLLSFLNSVPFVRLTPELGQSLSETCSDSFLLALRASTTPPTLSVHCVEYLAKSAYRICAKSYEPMVEDCTVVAAGCQQMAPKTFVAENGGLHFEIIELPGLLQSQNMNRVLRHFEDTGNCLFATSLLGYAQSSIEGDPISAMHEAIEFFSDLLGNRWMHETTFTLLFTDLLEFAEMLERHPMDECFDDCKIESDGSDTNAVREFVRQKFEERQPDANNNRIYAHFLDNSPDSIRKVMNNVFEQTINDLFNNMFLF